MKSETNPKTVMLKDYIIDMDSVSAKVTIDYEVVLENNTDFIVKRRTLKTDRELVVWSAKASSTSKIAKPIMLTRSQRPTCLPSCGT